MNLNNKKTISKIGLEIHLQLKTISKLFSSSKNSFNAPPNTNTSSYDWGYPGTLPQLNMQAFKLAIQAGYLFHAQIDHEVHFDRKNYYYFDLPKGYQITQFNRPLCQNGYFNIFLPNNEFKTIRINTVHLEEDTAKVIYKNNQILVDYNRSGVPLIEITTKPNFGNYQEVEIFLKMIIRMLKRANISYVQLEHGSMRVDVNISTSEDGINFCPLTEIKNLNSFKNIEKSIQQEATFQSGNFQQIKHACTKNYDENLKKLVFMRNKLSKHDYFFMRENNIAPFAIDSEMKLKLFQEVDFLLDWEEKFVKTYHLDFDQNSWILNNYNLIPYFQCLVNCHIEKNSIFLFLKEVIFPNYLRFQKNFSKINFELIKQLLTKYQEKMINFKLLKSIFAKYWNVQNIDLKPIITAHQSNQLSSVQKQEIVSFFNYLITHDDQLIAKYQKSPKQTTNYLMGQVYQKIKYKTNPHLLLPIINDFFSHLKVNKKS